MVLEGVILFSSGTEDSKFQDIVLHVSNDIPLNGTSNCDMFIHAYKNYKWDDLRPIEHIELLSCIEQRYVMRKMNEHFNVSYQKIYYIIGEGNGK